MWLGNRKQMYLKKKKKKKENRNHRFGNTGGRKEDPY